jgi:GNAT superfamily N-acetyltransferase
VITVASTPAHAAAVCELIKDMHADSQYASIKYDPYKVQRLVNTVINNQDSVILIGLDVAGDVVGFLALEQAQYMFNFENYVTDLGFYVKPQYRMTTIPYRLLTAGEQWSKQHGSALVLGVTAPADCTKTINMYSKLGYKPWGAVVRKELS